MDRNLVSTATTTTVPIIEDLRSQLDNCLRSIAMLREQNRRLTQDNQELRDLCCFLDDDRQKGKRLAREWQKFGRYTAKVMRQEVSSYQDKLRRLDGKQKDLVKENTDLKDLCLYLDEERNNNGSGVVDGNPCQRCGNRIGSRLRGEDTSKTSDFGSSLSDSSSSAKSSLGSSSNNSRMNEAMMMATTTGSSSAQDTSNEDSSSGTGPESDESSSAEVTRSRLKAMEVFRIHEDVSSLESSGFGTEKAILEEMCSVVLRAMGEQEEDEVEDSRKQAK